MCGAIHLIKRPPLAKAAFYLKNYEILRLKSYTIIESSFKERYQFVMKFTYYMMCGYGKTCE